MAAKGISGLGVAFMATGGVIAWAGINNVPVVDALRSLAKGQAIPSNRKPAFKPVDISFDAGAAAAGAGIGIATGASNGSILAAAQQVAASPGGRKNYCWGGGHTANPCGAKCFDCSGYVSCVLNRIGRLKGSKTTLGFLAWKELQRVPWASRQPGDLLINRSHMGIMINQRNMWNAACTACGPVKVSDYMLLGKRYDAYRLSSGGGTVGTASGVIQGG